MGETIEPTITSGHLRRFRGAPSISRRLTVESGTSLVSLLPAYMRFSLRPRDRSNERERPLRAVKAYFALAMERAALARTPVFPGRPLSDAAPRRKPSGRLASRTGAPSTVATSSSRFRRTATAISSRMCCTIGTTIAPP
jgi:hypothetical protein